MHFDHVKISSSLDTCKQGWMAIARIRGAGCSEANHQARACSNRRSARFDGMNSFCHFFHALLQLFIHEDLHFILGDLLLIDHATVLYIGVIICIQWNAKHGILLLLELIAPCVSFSSFARLCFFMFRRGLVLCSPFFLLPSAGIRWHVCGSSAACTWGICSLSGKSFAFLAVYCWESWRLTSWCWCCVHLHFIPTLPVFYVRLSLTYVFARSTSHDRGFTTASVQIVYEITRTSYCSATCPTKR